MKYINESGWDRIIRVVLGIVLLVLGFGGTLTGGIGLAAKILGVVLTLTGLVGFCLIYRIFNIRTNKKA